MKVLYLIPARGGSKGVPEKNLKSLGGKPLIIYAIDVARQLAEDADICVSTDDDEIIELVTSYGLPVPFKRPAQLATDAATSDDVIMHSLQYYESLNRKYDCVVLLQPTSPFRTSTHIEEAMLLYHNDVDLVMSVKLAEASPYINLYEEDESGSLKRMTAENISQRQSAPEVFQANGAIYIINTSSMIKYRSLQQFPMKLKYQMESKYSLDIDTIDDWNYCEYLLENNLIDLS